MKCDILKRVVDCAISNSINYKTKTLECDEKTLKSAIFSYAVSECGCKDEIEGIYRTSLESMKKRNRAINVIPVWVPLIFVLGFALLAMEIITIISLGFNVVFAFFLVLAWSLIGTGVSYLRTTSSARKATKMWRKCVSEGNADKMIDALRGIANTLR